ncbi:MAG: HPr family phosphocarrier protein [Gammaproteobacteria bacterium]
MPKSEVEVINKAGLHARAAAKLAELCGRYACEIQVGHEKLVDGKSILSLMMLAAVKGTTLTIKTEGPDEDEAMEAILELVNNRFDESE